MLRSRSTQATRISMFFALAMSMLFLSIEPIRAQEQPIFCIESESTWENRTWPTNAHEWRGTQVASWQFFINSVGMYKLRIASRLPFQAEAFRKPGNGTWTRLDGLNLNSIHIIDRNNRAMYVWDAVEVKVVHPAFEGWHYYIAVSPLKEHWSTNHTLRALWVSTECKNCGWRRTSAFSTECMCACDAEPAAENKCPQPKPTRCSW